MRGKMALPVLALLCLLTGCTAWTGDSYVSVTPHAEGYAQTEPALGDPGVQPPVRGSGG